MVQVEPAGDRDDQRPISDVRHPFRQVASVGAHAGFPPRASITPSQSFRKERSLSSLVLQLQFGIEPCQSSLVVTAAGDGLVASSPPGPGERPLRWQQRVPDHAADQAARFRALPAPSAGPGRRPGAPVSATGVQMTVSMAGANSAKVMCRYQPCHLRTSS